MRFSILSFSMLFVLLFAQVAGAAAQANPPVQEIQGSLAPGPDRYVSLERLETRLKPGCINAKYVRES
jgi:hypothetical protein